MMENLDIYISGDCYCSVCLRVPEEVRLLRATDVDFFTAVQVNQVTPYLCAWCRARLRSFHHVRDQALRSQYWLYNVHNSQSFLIESNKQNLVSELTEIKREKMRRELPQSASVTCEASFADLRPVHKSEDTNFTIEVKLDPDSQRREMDIKFDDVSVSDTWNDWRPADDTDADILNSSGSLAQGSVALPYKESDETVTNLVPQKRSKKGKRRYPDNLRRTCKINEANDKMVFLDELDDVGYMLADIMKAKIEAVMLTEADYWSLHRERLTKSHYTNLPHKCAKCALAFHKESLYAKHMDRHSPSAGEFACGLCGTYHQSRGELSAHAASHLRRYRCADCGHTAYNRQDVANHYFAEHSLLRFHCRHCRLQTKGPFLVKEHILTKHKKRDEPAEECPTCKKMIKPRNRVRHASSHVISAPLRCDECGGEFKNSVCLQQHVRKFHTVRPESLEECPVCNKTIASSARAAHARQHARAEAAFCAPCGKCFASAGGLKAHRERAHRPQRQRFTCDDCGAEYTSKAAVRRHISFLHLKLGGVACNVCGKIFSHLGDMHNHLRNVHQKHLARRDKLCDLCGKGFTTSKTLQNHRLIHTGEKPHACRECGQCFRQRSALQTHHKLKHLKMKMKDILSRRRRRLEEAASGTAPITRPLL